MSDPVKVSISYGEIRYVPDGAQAAPRRSWSKAFLDALSAAQTILLSAILFVSAGAIIWITLKEVASEAVVLEEIELAKPLTDMGYTGQVAAHRLWGAVNDIYEEAALSSQKAHLVAESRQLEITESKTGLSLRGLAGMLRALIGREQTVVGGEFVCRDAACSPDLVELRLRVFIDGEMRQALVGAIGPIQSQSDPESHLDDYFQRAAVELLQVLDPLVAASFLLYRDPPTAESLANKLYYSAHETSPQAAGLIGLIKAETGGYGDALYWYDEEINTSSGQDPTSDGNALVQWGFALQALGRPDEARQKFIAANALFDRAVDRQPNADAYNSWGWSLVSLGDSDGGIEKFQQAVKHDGDYAYAYAGWGMALAARGEHAAAAERFSLAIDIEPNYAFALANWGASLAQLGRYPEAFQRYAEAVRVAPDEPWILVEWGSHLVESGRLLAGWRKFAQAVELSPSEPLAIAEWSRRLTESGRVERARRLVDAYASREDLPPRSRGIARAMWARQLWLSDPDEAEAQFAAAAELAPEEAWVHSDWAEFRWQRGSRAEALDLFARAAAAAPGEASYAVVLSDRLWDELQHDRAIEQSARAASLAPDDPRYFEIWIDRLRAQDRHLEALAEYERRSTPVRTPAWISQRSGAAHADVRPEGRLDQAWLHAGWADYLWELGRREEAFDRYALAVAWAPGDGRYHARWADRLLEADDPRAANARYAVALRSEPQDPHALAMSGRALAALGRHDEAVLRYIDVAKSDPETPGLLEHWALSIDRSVGEAPGLDCAKLAALMQVFEPVAVRAEATDALSSLEADRDRCAAPPAAGK